MTSDNITRNGQRFERYTQIAPEASQVNIFTPSKHDRASPGPKQPFITLTKPFDINPKAVSYDPQEFNSNEHSHRSEPACGQNREQMQAKHYQLDRPWASRASNLQRQHLDKVSVDPLQRKATDMPFLHWMSERVGEAPYHMVDSVEGEFECRFEHKNDRGSMKGKGSGGKAATW